MDYYQDNGNQNTYGMKPQQPEQQPQGQQSYGAPQQPPFGGSNQQPPYSNGMGQSPYGGMPQGQQPYGGAPQGQQPYAGMGGAPQQSYGSDPYAMPQSGGQQGAYYSNNSYRLTKKEFINHSAVSKLKKAVISAAIFTYVLGGFNILLGFIAPAILPDMEGLGPGLIIVGIVIAGLGVGLQLAKSRACAIALLALAILNTILTLVQSGSFGGWLIIACGIAAVSSTFALHKAWNQYNTTGHYPGIS